VTFFFIFAAGKYRASHLSQNSTVVSYRVPIIKTHLRKIVFWYIRNFYSQPVRRRHTYNIKYIISKAVVSQSNQLYCTPIVEDSCYCICRVPETPPTFPTNPESTSRRGEQNRLYSTSAQDGKGVECFRPHLKYMVRHDDSCSSSIFVVSVSFAKTFRSLGFVVT